MHMSIHKNLDKPLMERAVRFAFDELNLGLLTETFNPMKLTVRMYAQKGRLLGLTEFIGNRVTVTINAGQHSTSETLFTVFHEMAHVQQIATGKLQADASGARVYMGEVYPENQATDPYERDADEVARKLLHAFV